MVDTSEAQGAVFVLFSLPTSISRQKNICAGPFASVSSTKSPATLGLSRGENDTRLMVLKNVMEVRSLSYRRKSIRQNGRHSVFASPIRNTPGRFGVVRMAVYDHALHL